MRADFLSHLLIKSLQQPCERLPRHSHSPDLTEANLRRGKNGLFFSMGLSCGKASHCASLCAKRIPLDRDQSLCILTLMCFRP